MFNQGPIINVNIRGYDGHATAESVTCSFPLSSIPGQVMWDLWWTKWHWGGFPPVLGFTLSVLTVLYSLIMLLLIQYSLDTNSVAK
jgi:hypothetical protein